MSKIEWTDEFCIDHGQIDEQHKKWIALYNKAHDQMMSYAGKEIMKIGQQALKEMIDYGKYHFSFEEEYMETIQFPGRADHARLHDTFARKLDHILVQMQNGEPMLNSEIIKIIENWLVDHILNDDQKIKQYIK
ncbi:MAG: hypothetical protein D3926_04420 [Desulfobacteraceae bacterium]|nr:MAG: hypothetical protein D3926_04420 [Desulfobacteraceae bacterium]